MCCVEVYCVRVFVNICTCTYVYAYVCKHAFSASMHSMKISYVYFVILTKVAVLQLFLVHKDYTHTHTYDACMYTNNTHMMYSAAVFSRERCVA